MPKVPTDRQLANIGKRSTERMLTHGWISSAVKDTGRRYEGVLRGSKSRKPLPEDWPAYWQVRGQIIELPERIPKRRVLRKEKISPSFRALPEEINSWAEHAVKEMGEQMKQFEQFLKHQGVKKRPAKMSKEERSKWFNKWNAELQKQGRAPSQK